MRNLERYAKQVTHTAKELENSYAKSGVDTLAGDLAVELMKHSVARTHGAEVLGGLGAFTGLYDASALQAYSRPLLATSTDGVGTKTALAIAIDHHDTIGQDLVGMVVDDIVTVGAKPLFMTDYIATGKLHPERVAAIVAGIARACEKMGTALIGGETAEHPGVMQTQDYDLAGAAVGVVEADTTLGSARVMPEDTIIAIASSGLHANGYSLVRHILAERNLSPTEYSAELGGMIGEILLEPTRLYTSSLLALIQQLPGTVHALSHITGGGIAANLARVLPQGSWAELERSSWSPPAVFRVLTEWGGLSLSATETTWNLGVGFLAVVAKGSEANTIETLAKLDLPAWVIGQVSVQHRELDDFINDTKGVSGGAVRLVGNYPS